MSTQSPPNTQSPRPRPPNTQSRIFEENYCVEWTWPVTTCQFVRLINSQVGLWLWLRLLRFVCNSHAEVWFIDNDRRGEVSLCDAEEGRDSRRRIFTTTRSDEEAGRIAAVVPATPLGIGGRRFVRTWFNWTSVEYEAVTYYITSGAAMAQRRWYVFTGVLYVCVVCECLFVCHYHFMAANVPSTLQHTCMACHWLAMPMYCGTTTGRITSMG